MPEEESKKVVRNLEGHLRKVNLTEHTDPRQKQMHDYLRAIALSSLLTDL